MQKKFDKKCAEFECRIWICQMTELMQLLTLQSSPACTGKCRHCYHYYNTCIRYKYIFISYKYIYYIIYDIYEYIFIYNIYNIIMHRPHDSPSHYEAVNAAECNCNVGNYFIKTSIDLKPRGISSNEHIQHFALHRSKRGG